MSDRSISLTKPPSGYADWLVDLKTRIHSAQQLGSSPLPNCRLSFPLSCVGTQPMR